MDASVDDEMSLSLQEGVMYSRTFTAKSMLLESGAVPGVTQLWISLIYPVGMKFRVESFVLVQFVLI